MGRGAPATGLICYRKKSNGVPAGLRCLLHRASITSPIPGMPQGKPAGE